MNIVILGAKGQLGRALVEALQRGETALGPIDKAYQSHKLFAFGKEEANIASLDQMLALAEECNPHIIFNCAAMTHVDGCETNEDLAMKINSLGARNAAMAAQKVGAKLVHISTDYVFDGNSQRPYEEWDVCNPVTVYGKSKRLGEEYVSTFSTRAFIIRVAWLYGHYGKNFVKTMVGLGREKQEINVVNDQIGNPTNAEDLVHHMLKLGITQEYGFYHCTGKGSCSWFDFASEIMKITGLSCKVHPCSSQEYPSPTKRPAYSALNHRMLTLTVGDEMRPWQSALEDYFKKEKQREELL